MVAEVGARGRRFGARRVMAAFALLGGAVWVRAFLAGPQAVTASGEMPGPRYRASGVVHVHTDLSDGRGTPVEVIDAAKRAAADFVVITDHNRADPKAFDGPTTEAGGPIVIVGSEISTEAGHVLAIGIRPPGFQFSGTLTEVLDDVRHLGGCAFVAHPTSPRGETRFTRESQQGTWGVEVVNGDTAWREASKSALAFAAWTYPVNSAFALRKTLGTFTDERALWDRVLARRFAPAIGGTDAHGRIPVSRSLQIPIPSYDSLFSLVRTVVNLTEPLGRGPASRAAIVRALCAGESSVAIPSLADPKGFFFVAKDSRESISGSGASLRFEPGITLRAGGALPLGARIRLLESGSEVATGEGAVDFAVSRPGVYRAEVYVKGEATPWILANPISILTAESERARADAALPVAEPPVQGAVSIDRFDGATAFAPEHDPGSSIDEPVIDTANGRGRGGAGRLSFHLNAKPVPPVWCALVDRTKRDLSQNRGVSFWLRADGEYRIWFQIRDLNPASADEGTEAWFASIRTSPAWTLYNVPFASLRSINRRSDGSFDPSKIAHIVFVIDHGAMAFGSSGKIWIDDLAAY